MSKHTDDLKAKWQQAEQKAIDIQAEKDEAIAKVRAKYTDRHRKANQQAADAQKEWCDAVAAEALLDRPDGEVIANALGLTLPN